MGAKGAPTSKRHLRASGGSAYRDLFTAHHPEIPACAGMTGFSGEFPTFKNIVHWRNIAISILVDWNQVAHAGLHFATISL